MRKMNIYSPIQKYVSIVLFLMVNVLFYFKYLYRISPIVALISTILYLIFSHLIFSKYYKNQPLISNFFTQILLIGYIISCVIVLYFIPKESLNVDRWEMIQVFWDAVHNGIYPYGVQGSNGNYPGPMPFYFILAYPFFLFNEIGYITIAGIVIWLCYTWIKDRKAFPFMALLLFSSLAVYWEIFARSTIFFNSCLFVLFLLSLKDFKYKSNRTFYFSAIAGGLLISTRNVFIIPLILWGMYILMREKVMLSRLIKWGLCFLLSFVISFIPFAWMDMDEFMKFNPFITQSSVLMPFYMVVFFIILSFAVSFVCKKFTDIIFYGGLLLFLTITGHAVFTLYRGGIEAYLTAGMDISYYIFSFPFFLKVITDKQ